MPQPKRAGHQLPCHPHFANATSDLNEVRADCLVGSPACIYILITPAGSSRLTSLWRNAGRFPTMTTPYPFGRIVHNLKIGYQQVSVGPKDWQTQVCSLGSQELYIDQAMPFGKANTSKIFCAWTDLWFSSFHWHFARASPCSSNLESYVDKAFGDQERKSIR